MMEYKVKNLSVNYEVFGHGKPIIMLHGYSPDHRLMSGCMEPIFKSKGGYKRIYIDLPGMGKTKGVDWITNADIMLDIIKDFIEKTTEGENFLLAGESYGGYLARGVVYKMMHKIDGLLLICPVIIADNQKRDVPSHVILEKNEELLSELNPNDAEELNSIVVQTKRIWERYRDEIQSGLKIADEIFLQNYQENGYEFSFDVDKIDEKFNKPALILLGKQDSVVGYRDVWNILNNYPRATFAVLDKAGHNLQIEQEELFNSLVNEWIERICESQYSYSQLVSFRRPKSTK